MSIENQFETVTRIPDLNSEQPVLAIRRATKDDAATLSRILLESSESVRQSDFTEAGWKLLLETNTVSASRKRFKQANYFALIAELEGEAVGYLAMLDYQKIDHMFVLPSARRRGICRLLWEASRKICEDTGSGDYYWVRASTMAETVYAKFGFVAHGVRTSRGGISSRLMKLKR